MRGTVDGTAVCWHGGPSGGFGSIWLDDGRTSQRQERLGWILIAWWRRMVLLTESGVYECVASSVLLCG